MSEENKKIVEDTIKGLMQKHNIRVMTPEEEESCREMREALDEAIKNDPDSFRIRRIDLLQQDLVSATLLYGTKRDDLFKHEEWFSLGAVPVMDATRKIITNEYNSMAKCLNEIASNPENAKELIAKYFPNGTIDEYDYDSLNYSK